MVKIINRQYDMIIPSRTGKALVVFKNKVENVSISDYQRLVSIYGKNVEKIKEEVQEEPKKVIEPKTTKHVKYKEIKNKK